MQSQYCTGQHFCHCQQAYPHPAGVCLAKVVTSEDLQGGKAVKQGDLGRQSAPAEQAER